MTAYAALSDLYVVMSLATMGSLSVARQQSILDARNDFADDFLRARYKLPAQAPFLASLVQNICKLAAYDCARVRGYNPAAGADVILEKDKLDALAWFDGVARQRIHPNIIEATGGTDPGYAAPLVVSRPLQGW